MLVEEQHAGKWLHLYMENLNQPRIDPQVFVRNNVHENGGICKILWQSFVLKEPREKEEGAAEILNSLYMKQNLAISTFSPATSLSTYVCVCVCACVCVYVCVHCVCVCVCVREHRISFEYERFGHKPFHLYWFLFCLCIATEHIALT